MLFMLYKEFPRQFVTLTHTHMPTLTAQEADVIREKGSSELQLICICALSILQDVCARICSGDISIRDLQKVHSKKAQMIKLCSAAAVDADNVVSNLEQRLRDHDHFMVYLRQLNHLFSFFSSARLQGTP